MRWILVAAMSNPVDGIIVDISRAIPGEMTELWVAGQKGHLTEAEYARYAEFTARVVIAWPFDVPISAENYLDLGLMDTRAVDDAVKEAADAQRGHN